MHREADGAVVDCSADVQEAAAARTVSASSRVASMSRRKPELVRFERSGLRLMRNLGAYALQFLYLRQRGRGASGSRFALSEFLPH